MNIFNLHENIISNYSSYISSFLNIQDEKIREKVNSELLSKKLIPEPLIQFNPSYKVGGTIESLINSGSLSLNKELLNVFSGFELYQHQKEAIEMGCRDESFVVTSGTGSGKSLTYIATILNKIFNDGIEKPGIKAVIVYPMNALINSQFNALTEFANIYEKNPGAIFPSFGKYTGQESEECRDQLRLKPPHILLTNYMMLELILTRAKEQRIIEALYKNCEFLVFDELHTYRGRQGADVALLIRRIKAQCVSKKIICIGTSATMASGEGTIQSQREEIANVATKIFGQNFTWENIITESIREAFPGADVSNEELKNEILNEIPNAIDEVLIKENKLARWIERNICLEKKEDKWMRAKPSTFKEIAEKLKDATGLDGNICQKKLVELLLWAEQINVEIASLRPRRSYLPYKIHQFIAQTGSVYTSLEDANSRIITLEAKNKTGELEGKIPLFQVVFSRYSGYEFICVKKNDEDSTLEAVPFNSERNDDDEESDTTVGYIILEKEGSEAVWDPEVDQEYLPDSWFNISKKNGTRTIKAENRHKLPVAIYFSKDGQFRNTPADGFIKGWFIISPLPFDPTSKTTFEGGNPREANKLARLGNEGRSTATTILSFLIIKELVKAIDDRKSQKLLCFSDIRQDVALQSGHFNDFIKVGQLRSAIHKAVIANEYLDYTNIDKEVFSILNLDQTEYAQVAADSGSYQYNENEKALKLYLSYRILYDLRRGWRVILPNLEQVGLLKIDYKGLAEDVKKDKWNALPNFEKFSKEKQLYILFQTLEFFRTSFAFHFNLYDNHEVNKKVISENLKEPWTLDKTDDLRVPNYLRVYKPYSKRQNIHTQSISAQSAYGKFIKAQFKSIGEDIKGEELNNWIATLLNLLSSSGILRKREGLLDQDLYQLNGNHVLWAKGDEQTPWYDQVRIRTRKQGERTVNTFFQDFYKQDFGKMKPIRSAEHTGQVKNEKRRKAEEDFIKGDVSALYCSPTMELGVDISELNIVQMRNVPPNPANYAQRSGRAGRSGQAALIVTYCSNTNPHDRHYFENRIEMVSGIVSPPKLDLNQEELLRSHLNALFLSRTNLGALNDSIEDILEMDADPIGLSLKQETKNAIHLEKEVIEDLERIYTRAIADIVPNLEKLPSTWYKSDWVKRKLAQAPESFDRAIDRWREIYKKCVEQLQASSQILGDPRIPRTDERKRNAENDRRYAEKQIELLRNKTTGSNNQLSEFYPYRYLAAEGFLPGYGFTKLPVRLFVPSDGGEYISRPKFIALREFGPHNTIYHSGGKYKVNQMLWSEMDNPMVSAKISTASGYILIGADTQRNVCPVTGADLTENANRKVISDMIEIRESRADVNDRITCEEEERQILGYDITTAFYLQSGLNNIEEILVKVDGEIFLRMQYLPAARIVLINNKWRVSKEGDGFLMGKKTGFWKRPAQLENRTQNAEEVQRIKLYAENTADALYIQPTKNLNLHPFDAGVTTLMYAIKRGFETLFQVESNEIGVSLMGTSEEPNMLLYESAEGSLGVIAQMVKDVSYFKKLIQSAWEICHFNKSEEEQQQFGAASYTDLLSFFNQRHHKIIDRYLIKNALETLMNANVEIKRSSLYKDYEHQYQELLKNIDPKSSTELKFLQYLYRNHLRLPDLTQVNMAKYGCYTIPDFVYNEEIKVCVFCDGTPHDIPKVAESDAIKRECLENLGYEVLVWHYLTPLDEFVKLYPHVFKTVKN
ncbi:MAG TPA: DEAD/DEAH box helicase [Bacteroidales bacterium]|nr:DEAD/DEAH box helicase [Bacteroidales bacterium]